MRKPPVRHEVGKHTRGGKTVQQYPRGSGQRAKRKSKVVGKKKIVETFDYHGVLIPKVITDRFSRIGTLLGPAYTYGRTIKDVFYRYREHIDRIELERARYDTIDILIYFVPGTSEGAKRGLADSLFDTSGAGLMIKENGGWEGIGGYPGKPAWKYAKEHGYEPSKAVGVFINSDVYPNHAREAFG